MYKQDIDLTSLRDKLVQATNLVVTKTGYNFTVVSEKKALKPFCAYCIVDKNDKILFYMYPYVEKNIIWVFVKYKNNSKRLKYCSEPLVKFVNYMLAEADLPFKNGDIVRIKKEWCDNPKEYEDLYQVFNLNEDTLKCSLALLNAEKKGFAFGYTTLVSFEMIEMVTKGETKVVDDCLIYFNVFNDIKKELVKIKVNDVKQAKKALSTTIRNFDNKIDADDVAEMLSVYARRENCSQVYKTIFKGNTFFVKVCYRTFKKDDITF